MTHLYTYAHTDRYFYVRIPVWRLTTQSKKEIEMKKTKVSLVCVGGKGIKKVKNTNDGINVHIYETHAWLISDSKAEELKKCGVVYLHDSKKTKSYHGGLIIDVTPSVDNPRRKVIRYCYMADCINAPWLGDTDTGSNVISYN